MGLVETIQNLSQIGWLGTPRQDSSHSKSAEGRGRAANPAEARTPEEALAYIRLLSQAGRTAELAELLRRSPVFREAWQTLQQFSAPGWNEAGEFASSLPSPPGASPQNRLPSQGRASLPVATASGASGKDQADEDFPVLSSRPTRPFAAACRIYQAQDSFFPPKGAGSPRISLRV